MGSETQRNRQKKTPEKLRAFSSPLLSSFLSLFSHSLPGVAVWLFSPVSLFSPFCSYPLTIWKGSCQERIIVELICGEVRDPPILKKEKMLKFEAQ
jgi:hypothetical protein